MKINWGTGIAIFYSLFMVVMILMVVKSTQNKTHLVQENYYNKDLNYEEFRVKRQNAQLLTEQIAVKYDRKDGNISVIFPKDMTEVSGKVSLFRPSNKFLDKKYNLKLDSNARMRIPIDKSMRSGLWRVQVDWESGGKQYYSEEDIVL